MKISRIRAITNNATEVNGAFKNVCIMTETEADLFWLRSILETAITSPFACRAIVSAAQGLVKQIDQR